jgi:hypothetical protein
VLPPMTVEWAGTCVIVDSPVVIVLPL